MWMTVEDALSLQTYYGRFGAEEMLADCLEDLIRQVSEYEEYGYLIEAMKVQGPEDTDPIEIVNGHLEDGHHRVAIAYLLGWQNIRAATCP